MSSDELKYSIPAFPRTRGSTTEPNTSDELSRDICAFARLIPINSYARLATQMTVNHASDYHRGFLKEHVFDNRLVLSFELSLSNLPELSHIGWRIGRGRSFVTPKFRRGLLLFMEDDPPRSEAEDPVAGIHARFNWVKGGAGFFLIADNKRGKRAMLNGEFLIADQRLIQPRNSIMIDECLFTLEYVFRTPEEEEHFHPELTRFFRDVHRENNPMILSTANKDDLRFHGWIFQRPISRGAFGTVYIIVNSRTGNPAAAKRILKSMRNETAVDREISMATRVAELHHVS